MIISSKVVYLETINLLFQAFEPNKVMFPNQTLSLTEIHQDEEHPPLSTVSNGSVNSDMSTSSKNSVASNVTNTTASVSSNKSVDLTNDFSEHDSSDKSNRVEKISPSEVITLAPNAIGSTVIPTSIGISPISVPILSVPTMTLPGGSGNVEVSVLIPASPTVETLPTLPTSDTSGVPTSTINISNSQTITNAPIGSSQSNGGPSETVKVRKVSPISQSSGRDSPKREVYV